MRTSRRRPLLKTALVRARRRSDLVDATRPAGADTSEPRGGTFVERRTIPVLNDRPAEILTFARGQEDPASRGRMPNLSGDQPTCLSGIDMRDYIDSRLDLGRVRRSWSFPFRFEVGLSSPAHVELLSNVLPSSSCRRRNGERLVL